MNKKFIGIIFGSAAALMLLIFIAMEITVYNQTHHNKNIMVKKADYQNVYTGYILDNKGDTLCSDYYTLVVNEDDQINYFSIILVSPYDDPTSTYKIYCKYIDSANFTIPTMLIHSETTHHIFGGSGKLSKDSLFITMSTDNIEKIYYLTKKY